MNTPGQTNPTLPRCAQLPWRYKKHTRSQLQSPHFSRALTFSAHQLGGVLVGAKLAATHPVATDHILRLDGHVTLGGRRARFVQSCAWAHGTK